MAEAPYCVRVVPGALSLKHCALHLPPQDQILAGRPCRFRVDLCDCHGNRCCLGTATGLWDNNGTLRLPRQQVLPRDSHGPLGLPWQQALPCEGSRPLRLPWQQVLPWDSHGTLRLPRQQVLPWDGHGTVGLPQQQVLPCDGSGPLRLPRQQVLPCDGDKPLRLPWDSHALAASDWLVSGWCTTLVAGGWWRGVAERYFAQGLPWLIPRHALRGASFVCRDSHGPLGLPWQQALPRDSHGPLRLPWQQVASILWEICGTPVPYQKLAMPVSGWGCMLQKLSIVKPPNSVSCGVYFGVCSRFVGTICVWAALEVWDCLGSRCCLETACMAGRGLRFAVPA